MAVSFKGRTGAPGRARYGSLFGPNKKPRRSGAQVREETPQEGQLETS